MSKQFLHLIILLLATSVAAQPNKKVGPALTKFLNTEFMVKYRDLRIEAESAAIGAQSKRDQMASSELFRLRTAYDQTATRANQILEGVKQDFLNAKKLKSIADFPEMYSDGLRYKLQELSDFYAANFQQALADASIDKEEVDGGAVLLLVIELIGLTKGLTSYFADIKREARQYTETHLQENLVKPYRWRYWDELSGSASPYEKFEKSSELNLMEQPKTEDRLDQQLQKMNQVISNLPSKENPSEGYNGSNFELPQEGSYPSDTTSTFQYEDWSPNTETPGVNAAERDKPVVAPKPSVPAKPAKTLPKATKTAPKKDN